MSRKVVVAPEEAPVGTSFEEKSAWIQFIALLLVLGGYFVIAGQMLAVGIRALPPFVPVFAIAVVLLVVVLVVGHIAAAIVTRQQPRDERDRWIQWRAESQSSWLLGVGVLGAIHALVFGVEAVWVAHLLLAALLLSELLGLALQLVGYRRGY